MILFIQTKIAVIFFIDYYVLDVILFQINNLTCFFLTFFIQTT